jgi:hypothetical protein
VNTRIKMMCVGLILLVLVASPGLTYALDSGGLGSTGASLVGAAAGDSAGYSMAPVGDVNGDGYDDLLIGAPGSNTGGADAGAAYLILGRPGGWGSVYGRGWGQGIDLESGGAIAYIGEASGDNAGRSVAGVGDVNGDGYADMLIGAYGNNEGGADAGAAYLVLGSMAPTGGNLAGNPPLFEPIKYSGETPDDYASQSVAGAGDINGDGYADFLIGAPRHDNGGDNAGAAYLVLGSATPTSGSLSSVIQYTGEAADSGAGQAVAGAGDVNGDGYADFLVGAPRQDDGGNDAGAAYLVLGSATPISGSLSSAIQYTGEAADNGAGQAVAGAGDVSGDGYADILIGAPHNGDGGSEAGTAYLILGSATPTGGNLSSAIQYTGKASGDLTGESVAGAGDVNGDGYADLLISATGNDDAGLSAGAAYLVLGSANPTGDSLSSFMQYTGEETLHQAGWCVTGAGDMNGDGYADFLISSRHWSSMAGAVYLVFSDYLAPGAAPIRQRQRLLGNSGDALPARFEPAKVSIDFTSNAVADGDITVERHIFHPCSTQRRLQTPIWTISSSKQQYQGQSRITLRFHYSNAQIAGMDEAGLKVWSRPIGQPCGEWSEVSGSVVTPTLNLISVSGLQALGYQYTIAASQPTPTMVEVASMDTQPGQESAWMLVPLLALVTVSSGFAYWRQRREQKMLDGGRTPVALGRLSDQGRTGKHVSRTRTSSLGGRSQGQLSVLRRRARGQWRDKKR